MPTDSLFLMIENNKTKMRFTLKFIILTVLILVLLFLESVVAQPPPPPPQEIPIDGGLGVLLAAGLFYGAKKLREGKKAPQ